MDDSVACWYVWRVGDGGHTVHPAAGEAEVRGEHRVDLYFFCMQAQSFGMIPLKALMVDYSLSLARTDFFL